MSKLKRTMVGLACMAAWTGCGAEPVESEGEVRAETEDLVGGTQSWVRQAIGSLGGCTATLVDPSYVATAAHCFSGTSGPQNVTFQTYTNAGALGVSSKVDYAFAAWTNTTNPGTEDFALGRLQTPITTVNPMSFGLVPPSAGATVTAWGFGCSNRVTGAGGGGKQYLTYIYPTSSADCPGDSGGPRTYGAFTSAAAIWGINSGYYGDGSDAVADATYYGYNVLDPVRKFGVPPQVKASLADFTSWASTAGVKVVTGDFNADGTADIALTGVSGWGSIPVAFGDGVGAFSVTNSGVANFPAWAASARSAVAGDFDGDGDTDIALVGNSNWGSIPVAFSNRNGTFTVSNLATANFPVWGAAAGAYAVAGDFDGDNDADIALVGGQGWNTVPVAFSARNGAFSVTNTVVANFPAWSQTANAKCVVGDFDHDGDADLAVTGVPGWGSIPTAFSNRSGGFSVTNTAVFGFPGLAVAEAKYTSGDFDGDGKADIALVGRLGDTSNIYFAMSRGDGAYNFWVLPIPFIPALAQRTSSILAGRNTDVTDHSSLMLLGGGVPYVMTVRL